MSHRIKEKQARRAERERKEAEIRRREQRKRRGGYVTVALVAAGLLAVAVVAGGGNDAPGEASPSDGNGPRIGATAPDFELTDVVANTEVSRNSLAGQKTLLFFSEGVGCQACMVQIGDLEKSKELSELGIKVVSVTTDPPDDLAAAAAEYGIETPLLADESADVSTQYGMLGHGGMGHPTKDGHAFMLLDANGKVEWHRAYQEMYVETEKLLSDMRAKA